MWAGLAAYFMGVIAHAWGFDPVAPDSPPLVIEKVR